MNIQIIHPNYKKYQSELEDAILNFQSKGEIFGDPRRNVIKAIELKDLVINVKSFKKPGFINKVIYGYFRKSKAFRSYTYASYLASKNIGTPQPIAYIENKDFLGLTTSYYISEHIDADLTYRELVKQPNYPDHEIILRAFVHYTHQLHENNVLFKDHSPGNTLVKKENQSYKFFLVDLNRIKFKDLSFEERMKNFSRLTPKQEMVVVMSDEYSKITGIDYSKVFKTMWSETSKFQEKFFRKRRLKKQFLFWKKKYK